MTKNLTPMHTLPDWNATRFHVDDARGHVESFFIKANSPDGNQAIWLKATILASPGRAAYALTEGWAIVFRRGNKPVAAKQSLRRGESRFSSDSFEVHVGDIVHMDSDGSEGNLTRNGHSISWKIRWVGDRKPMNLLPYPWLFSHSVPVTKVVTPMPDLVLRGQVLVDGETIEVDGWKGMQGHNWGRRHATPYSWGQCNCWEQDEELVIEVATGRLHFGPLTMPPRTLMVLRHRGETLALNTIPHMLRNEATIMPRRWLVRAVDKRVRVNIDFAVHTDDLVGLYYPNPDGKVTYVANSKLAFAKATVTYSGQPAIELTTHCAAWEFAEAHPPRGVQMLV